MKAKEIVFKFVVSLLIIIKSNSKSASQLCYFVVGVAAVAVAVHVDLAFISHPWRNHKRIVNEELYTTISVVCIDRTYFSNCAA